MAKFNARGVRPASGRSHINTIGPAVNAEGGPGFVSDAKGELFRLAVVNFVGEDTFYESGADRDARFNGLARKVAVEDFEWLSGMLGWLRTGANMRSASLTAAAQAVHARLEEGLYEGNSALIDSVLQRADEPGEFLAYWQAQFDPESLHRRAVRLPPAVRRGVGAAAVRLYNEKSFLKWDSAKRGVRMADVIELTHPLPDGGVRNADRCPTPDKVRFATESAAPTQTRKGEAPLRAYKCQCGWFHLTSIPLSEWGGSEVVPSRQSLLFRYILDDRHHGDAVPNDALPMLAVRRRWDAMSDEEKLDAIKSRDADQILGSAGLTWENVLSDLGGMTKKSVLWNAVAPTMGLMALIRNLRNFDEANIDRNVARRLAERIADPREVAKSRLLPFRFLSAYLAAPSDRWKQPLTDAVEESLKSVPSLPGRTLVLVDTSASMNGMGFSARSSVTPAMAGALLGVVFAARQEGDLYGFASDVFEHRALRGEGVLSQAKGFVGRIGEVGHGTQMTAALRKTYKGHARVVVVSDMQCFSDGGRSLVDGGSVMRKSIPVPDGVPVYGVHLGGGAVSAIDTRVRNRHEFAGLTDQIFAQIAALESGGDSNWPWLI